MAENAMDLEKKILEDMSKEFQKSIDYSSAYYLMMCYWESQGWTKVMLPKLQDNKHAVDITYWLVNNGYVDRENYCRDGREFVFRDPEMATAFVLRWAG